MPTTLDAVLSQFTDLPGVDHVRSLTGWFARAHGLVDRHEHGVHWGMTLPSKRRGDQIRVNVGPQHAYYAEFLDDGWWCFVNTVKNDAVAEAVARHGDRVVLGAGPSSPFAPEQYEAIGRPSAIAELLLDGTFFAASSELVQLLVTRRLPKADRANGAVTEYVLGEAIEARPPSVPGVVGRVYESVPEVYDVDGPDPMAVSPSRYERGLVSHRRLQNWLARELMARGIVALQPTEADAAWDLAWRTRDGWVLVEVKSTTRANEEQQLTYALGEILRHDQRYRTDAPTLLVLVDELPVDRSWQLLFQEHDVLLLGKSDVPGFLDAQR